MARPLSSHPGGNRLDLDTETFVAHTLRAEGFDASEDGTGRGTPLVPVAFQWTDSSGIRPGDICPTLKVGSGLDIPSGPAVAYQCHGANVGEMVTPRKGNGTTTGGVPFVANPMAVRRLTPVEAERLQGFPDDWTLIPWKGKPAESCPDGPRYKALGNSMAVPVMAWIGRRIEMVRSL